MSGRPDFETLRELPADERLGLVEAVWNSVVTYPTSMPLPDWHLDVLRQRMADDDAARDDGASWADVRAGIERP
jgi:putative addiction module component (TIGR02574 family)